MTGFDVRAYENDVLKPLRKQLPHLSGDLLTRYAVRLDLSEAQMLDRVKAVVQHWNKVAMRPGQLAQVCKRLQREHQDRLKADPDAFASMAWWADWVKKRGQELAPEIADLTRQLTASYGPLGAITQARLVLDAAAHGALGAAELDRARKDAGLELVEPLDLPTSPGTRGPYKSFENELISIGADSVIRLVHPELTGFGLVGGVSVVPPPPRPALSRAALEAQAEEVNMRPDSTAVRASKAALGFLKTEEADGTDLVALTLYHLLVSVREKRAEGVSLAQPLFTLLTRTGLRKPDAARIALSVLGEHSVRKDPVAEVTELLGEGQLEAARRLATQLQGAEGTAAREAVDRQQRKVDELRRLAREDLATGHHERAGDRLREAVRLATDLEELAGELAGIPAPPVGSVSANVDGGGVRIGWQPASGHDNVTEFRVVRREGRAPADADDGRPIAVKSGHATLDQAPPVGRRLHYAVLARAGTGPWSPPVSADVRVVPPVTDVVVEGEEKSVVGRWRTHPDVSGVEVTRRTGGSGPTDSIRVEQHNSFRDAAVTDGEFYHYTIVASYLTSTGVLRAEPVVVRGATRPKARPVTTLTASAAATDTGTAVRLAWRQRTGSEVVIRRAARPCPWEYGEVVPLAELAGYGDELDGVRTEKGNMVTLIAPAPLGRSHCVAFTLGPAGAVRGEHAVVDLTEPVRRVRAQRFGEDIRVTWTWPDEVSTVDVSWHGGHRRITRQQYRDEGGCQVHRVPRVTRVDVRAVIPGVDGEIAGGAPVTSVEVARVPPRLSYQIRRRGHPLLGGVKCTVTVTAADTAIEVTLLLVAAAGPVMPLSPNDCHELLRKPIRVGPGVPQVLPEVAVPTYLRRPYWLRCFLVEPVTARLDDPPTSQLKVS